MNDHLDAEGDVSINRRLRVAQETLQGPKRTDPAAPSLVLKPMVNRRAAEHKQATLEAVQLKHARDARLKRIVQFDDQGHLLHIDPKLADDMKRSFHTLMAKLGMVEENRVVRAITKSMRRYMDRTNARVFAGRTYQATDHLDGIRDKSPLALPKYIEKPQPRNRLLELVISRWSSLGVEIQNDEEEERRRLEEEKREWQYDRYQNQPAPAHIRHGVKMDQLKRMGYHTAPLPARALVRRMYHMISKRGQAEIADWPGDAADLENYRMPLQEFYDLVTDLPGRQFFMQLCAVFGDPMVSECMTYQAWNAWIFERNRLVGTIMMNPWLQSEQKRKMDRVIRLRQMRKQRNMLKKQRSKMKTTPKSKRIRMVGRPRKEEKEEEEVVHGGDDDDSYTQLIDLDAEIAELEQEEWDDKLDAKMAARGKEEEKVDESSAVLENQEDIFEEEEEDQGTEMIEQEPMTDESDSDY